jgi:hypothetical protein
MSNERIHGVFSGARRELAQAVSDYHAQYVTSVTKKNKGKDRGDLALSECFMSIGLDEKDEERHVARLMARLAQPNNVVLSASAAIASRVGYFILSKLGLASGLNQSKWAKEVVAGTKKELPTKWWWPFKVHYLKVNSQSYYDLIQTHWHHSGTVQPPHAPAPRLPHQGKR